jgi:hypothetical protein
VRVRVGDRDRDRGGVRGGVRGGLGLGVGLGLAVGFTGWCLMLQRAAAFDGLVRPISRACSPCAWCTLPKS